MRATVLISRVMTTRGGSLAVAAFVLSGGCGEDMVDGFPVEVREYLETFRQPAAPIYECPPGVDCAAAATLGQRLFFDADYSDQDPGGTLPVTRVACASCHDPALAFADNSASSPGVGFTGRNAPGLTNLAYRIADGHRLLWNGAGRCIQFRPPATKTSSCT